MGMCPEVGYLWVGRMYILQWLDSNVTSVSYHISAAGMAMFQAVPQNVSGFGGDDQTRLAPFPERASPILCGVGLNMEIKTIAVD